MDRYYITLPDNTVVSSGWGTKNAIASLKQTAVVNSGTDLTMGSVCAAMLEITLITPHGDFALAAGEEITLHLSSDDMTSRQMGVFRVEKPTRLSANRTKLTAYDYITKLDKDLTAWLASLNRYPYPLIYMIELVCEQCGVSLAPNQIIPNANFLIEKKPTDSTVTGRQLMQWCAEIAGSFVTANEDGELVFGWYEDSGITIEPSGENFFYSGSLSYEDYEVKAVDAVQIRMLNSEDGALVPGGEFENPYIIENNRLLTSPDQFTVSAEVLGPMLEAVAFSYTPCRLSVPASTGVEVGQIITVRDINGKEIKVPVMETVRSGQRINITATGNATRSTSEGIYSDQNLKDYADNAASSAVNKQTQQDIFNKLTNNSEDQGLYLKDGKVYLNATFLQTGVLNADLIRAGRIRSTDFEIGPAEMIYPGTDVYPSNTLYPSNGEAIVKGFEIDFESGVIRGAFWAEPIARLQERVDAIDARLKAIEDKLA